MKSAKDKEEGDTEVSEEIKLHEMKSPGNARDTIRGRMKSLSRSRLHASKQKFGFTTVRLLCGKPGIYSDNSCATHFLRFLKAEV